MAPRGKDLLRCTQWKFLSVTMKMTAIDSYLFYFQKVPRLDLKFIRFNCFSLGENSNLINLQTFIMSR